ncbi:MAG TPA: M28 family peptidase [Gemmatimonadales bacterium]|nr:M28 family peptidase [Gemmatimonadales bacterium]
MRGSHRNLPRLAGAVGVLAAVACAPSAPATPEPAQSTPASHESAGLLPLKHAPQPTSADISVPDLMTRLYIYADDSMMGREAGTIGNVKATDYIAGQVKQLGLQPAGENGTYFQTVNMIEQGVDTASTLTVAGSALALGKDYVVLPQVPGFLPFGDHMEGQAVPVIYGGPAGDTTGITAAQAAGKLVVLSAPADQPGKPGWQFWSRGGLDRYPDAVGIAVATLDVSPPPFIAFLAQPQSGLDEGEPQGGPAPLGILISNAIAEQMLGAPLSGLKPGAAGKTVDAAVRYRKAPVPYPARNVVAILPGRDPVLKHQYVAIGAHNDHVGIQHPVVEHDSLKAFNRIVRPRGAEDQPRPATADEMVKINAIKDSLRKISPPRLDSIANGADDDGSGTVSVLEIAQKMASLKGDAVPRRSILFVWHTGEEKGLYGSQWFTDHPTVPRDSIVAQLNIDMIGRGTAADVPGMGGDDYLQLIGSRRLSTQLGDLVDSVNQANHHGFKFDYSYDAPGHPAQIYCRSDHYMYARYGIPITFFTTNEHQDYHQVTDEPQYIDYPHMARVAQLVDDIAMTVANRDQRLVVDHPKPDPHAACRQ